jgi:hypothetical protein
MTLTISSQELADSFWSHFPPSSLHVIDFIEAAPKAQHNKTHNNTMSALLTSRESAKSEFTVGHHARRHAGPNVPEGGSDH